jgi:hypothetical protein
MRTNLPQKLTPDNEARRLLWWNTLSHQEQIGAIQRLAAQGISEPDLASATRLSIEMIRKILGQHPQCEGRE